MLFVLEGASASGKSTVRDRLTDKHPGWVRWKGENLMRKGVGDQWVDYRERYHEALHRLYELNPDNVILADRGFTDCVYNSDEQMREEFRRLAACYGNAHILYFYPGEVEDASQIATDGAGAQMASDSQAMTGRHGSITHDSEGRDVLWERGSRDMPKLSRILREYGNLLQMFPYKHINTDELSEEAATVEVEQYIEKVAQEYGHNPDL